jgi:hypothetical protein
MEDFAPALRFRRGPDKPVARNAPGPGENRSGENRKEVGGEERGKREGKGVILRPAATPKGVGGWRRPAARGGD